MGCVRVGVACEILALELEDLMPYFLIPYNIILHLQKAILVMVVNITGHNPIVIVHLTCYFGSKGF